jgi:hypothetical protein
MLTAEAPVVVARVLCWLEAEEEATQNLLAEAAEALVVAVARVLCWLATQEEEATQNLLAEAAERHTGAVVDRRDQLEEGVVGLPREASFRLALHSSLPRRSVIQL